jgi:hypothetical protein
MDRVTLQTVALCQDCTISELKDEAVKNFIKAAKAPSAEQRFGWRNRLAKIMKNCFVFSLRMSPKITFLRAAISIFVASNDQQ